MLDHRDLQTLAVPLSAIVVIFLLLRWIKRRGDEDNGKRYPPSLPILPVFGAIIRGGMTVLPAHFMRSAEKFGPVFSFTIGKRMVVVINGYDAIFDALAKHSEAFADRLPLWADAKLLNPELRGIVYAHYNDAYRKHHKLSLSILKDFGFGSQRVSETRILQEVETMHAEILKQNGRPFYPNLTFLYATANVVLSILFGRNFQQSLPDEHSTIVKCSSECMKNMDMAVNMAPIVRFLPMFSKKIETLRINAMRQLRAIEAGIQFIKDNNSEPTFVGRFIEIEGSDYNHQDLLYVLRDLCFGSTNTVSTTLQWAVVELANHPEIQNRFQKEIDEMVPEDRLPSFDDKPRLPYTEAVILEVMRRRTVVPFFVPHGTLRDTKVLDYDVPEGTLVIPNGYSAHMDSTFWKDPENFRPERFLDTENKLIGSRRVIPFGLGKRTCIGDFIGLQEVFLFLTSLVQRFDIRPPEGRDTIVVKEVTSLTTFPSPFEVRLMPRVKPTQC